MPDQAATLRKLAKSALPVAAQAPLGPPVIVVAGARRGVGVTTVAVNVGVALADLGERVVLIDAAEQAPRISQVAGCSTIDFSIADVMSGNCRADQALAAGPLGMQILAHRRNSAAVIDTSRAAQHRLLAELNTMHEAASVVVADVGSGHSPWTRRFWRHASRLILVTTADDLVLLDCYAAIKRAAGEAIDTSVSVLANQCDSDAVAKDMYNRLSNACRRFLSNSVQSLPPLPRSGAYGDHDDGSTPRIWEEPNSRFARSTLWLARAVSDIIHETVAS